MAIFVDEKVKDEDADNRCFVAIFVVCFPRGMLRNCEGMKLLRAAIAIELLAPLLLTWHCGGATD